MSETEAVLFGVVVLAGGGSRRWAGVDKTAALLAGRPVLAHVLDGVAAAFGSASGSAHGSAFGSTLESVVPVVVVGPADHPVAASARDGVRWVREQPPGGGPVAGLAAGLAALPDDVRLVGVLAGDAPFAAPAVRRLLEELAELGGWEALGSSQRISPTWVESADSEREHASVDRDGVDRNAVDAVIGQDAAGRRQPLIGAYAIEPLRAALAAEPGAGRAVRDVLAALAVRTSPVDAREALDLDTPADLEAAGALLAP